MKFIPWWRWEVQCPWTTCTLLLLMSEDRRGNLNTFLLAFVNIEFLTAVDSTLNMFIIWFTASPSAEVSCNTMLHRKNWGVKYQRDGVEEEEEEERNHVRNYRWLDPGIMKSNRLFIIVQNWKSSTARNVLSLAVETVCEPVQGSYHQLD